MSAGRFSRRDRLEDEPQTPPEGLPVQGGPGPVPDPATEVRDPGEARDQAAPGAPPGGATATAQQRANDEITALEEDLERAKRDAASKLSEIESRLRSAEARAEGAEQRVAAELAAREREIEELRAEKTQILESSDHRLEQIEARAGAAAERVAVAEQQLAKRAQQLTEHARNRIAEETERAQAAAKKVVRSRIAEREKELEQARQEAEERAHQAEQRAHELESAAAERDLEIRSAATKWLRGQADALRREGQRDAEDQIRDAVAAAEERALASLDEHRKEISRLESELATTSRQLEEAQDRAAAAEQHVRDVEAETRHRLEREHEARVKELDSRLGAVAEHAKEAEERARLAEVKTGYTPPMGIPQVAPPREPSQAPEAPLHDAAEEGDPEPEQAEQGTSDRRASLRERRWVFGLVGRKRQQPETEGAEVAESQEPEPAAEPEVDLVDLNTASFVQLRELGMSVRQARRVINHREREGGFDSLEQLDEIPGFPPAFLPEVKRRLTV